MHLNDVESDLEKFAIDSFVPFKCCCFFLKTIPLAYKLKIKTQKTQNYYILIRFNKWMCGRNENFSILLDSTQ